METKPKPRGPYCKIKNGNVSVPIWRSEQGLHRLRVVWYDAERKRRQRAIGDEAEVWPNSKKLSSAILRSFVAAHLL
jgi:hypothetical protein